MFTCPGLLAPLIAKSYASGWEGTGGLVSIREIFLTPWPILESGSESPEGDTRLSILSIFGSASDPIVFVLIIFCLSD